MARGSDSSYRDHKYPVSTLKMMPIPEGVAIPNFFTQVKDGKFEGNELNQQGVAATLNELHKWAEALAPLREEIRNRK